MSHHDFDSKRKKIDPKKEGPSFTLCEQEFHCLPALSGATVNAMALAIRVDDRGRQVYNAPNVIAFIHDCLAQRLWVKWEYEGETGPDAAEGLKPEQIESIRDEKGYWEVVDDRARFMKIVEGNEDIVELETLIEIMNALSEDYGERPTQRSKR
jgi:hypothetical protein